MSPARREHPIRALFPEKDRLPGGADLFNTPSRPCSPAPSPIPTPAQALGQGGELLGVGIGVFAARDRPRTCCFPPTRARFGGSLAQEAYTTVGRFRRDYGRSSYVGALTPGGIGDGYGNQSPAWIFHQFDPSTSLRLQYLGSRTKYPDSTALAAGSP